MQPLTLVLDNGEAWSFPHGMPFVVKTQSRHPEAGQGEIVVDVFSAGAGAQRFSFPCSEQNLDFLRRWRWDDDARYDSMG